jgi:capsular exopolysaccharide synthesis family protein
MSTTRYLGVLRARWLTLVLFALLGLAAGAALLLTATPQYRSTATLYVAADSVRGATDAYQGSLLSQDRVKSYRELLASDRVADQVATRLGGVTGAELLRTVSVTNTPETTLLLVTVTDASPERAALVANTYGDVFAQVAGTLETSTPGAGTTPAVSVRTALPARPDPTAVSPDPGVDLGAGLVIGLLVGAGVAVARSSLDRRVNSSEQLAELAEVPDLGRVQRDPRVERELLTVLHHPHTSAAEAVRKLRSNLRFVTVDQDAGVVMLTSAQPAEGKSATSANLAASLADLGDRVLLLEADLRRPRLGAALGLEAAVGLTSVLSGALTARSAVQRVGRLDVLLAGAVPPNPSELLDSRRMAGLLDELRGQYDWVIVDSAPLLPVTDAAVLARRCDGVVLLARHGSTTTGAVRQATTVLRTAGATLLGSVLTMAPKPGRSEAGYGSYYHDGVDDDTTSATTAVVPATRPAPGAHQAPSRPERPVTVDAPAVVVGPAPGYEGWFSR